MCVIILCASINGQSIGTRQTLAGCEQNAYKASVVPENLTVAEKKLRFRCLVQPAIEEVFTRLTNGYLEASTWIKADSHEQELDSLRAHYRVDNNEALLKAMKPHPRSIAMAQAALESAWGTSRFFIKANNIFGIWSYNKNEPRIPAGDKRGSNTIWLKKYSSLAASIEDYYLLLARGRAYKEFRTLKMKSSDPYLLAKKLDHYSELRAKYVEKLSNVIRHNKFEMLDTP